MRVKHRKTERGETNHDMSEIHCNKDQLKKPKPEGIRHPCDLCDSTFSSPGTLKTHKKLKHDGIEIAKHGEISQDMPEILFSELPKKPILEGIRHPCDLCDSTFSSPSGLKTHKKSKHDGIRYPCDECSSTYTSLGKLSRHNESKHQGIRFPCDRCDSIYTSDSSLKSHKKFKHDGIVYPCELCPSKYASQVLLDCHKKSKHQGIKYPCNQCEFTFTTPQGLTSHMQTRFPCDMCEATFSDFQSLERHRIVKHRSTKVELCNNSAMYIEDKFHEALEEIQTKKEDIFEEDPLSLPNTHLVKQEDVQTLVKMEKTDIEEDFTCKEEQEDVMETKMVKIVFR